MLKEDFEKIKNKYVEKYQNEILSLRKTYVDSYDDISNSMFIRLNQKYRELIISLIKDLNDEFKKIYNINFCITLSGSLGRNSNTLFSDVDINYLSLDNDYDVIIEIEDKINYIIQEVLQFRGKDKLHSMVVYLPLISNRNVKKLKDDNYELTFVDGIINVPCRKNANKLLYETYNSTRNLDDVINYFNSYDTQDNINEWTYCFKFIYNDKYKEVFDKKRKTYRNSKNIKTFCNELIAEIKNDDLYLDIRENQIENCKLKKIYKSNVLTNFYKLLAIDFRLEENIDEFVLDEFYLKSKLIRREVFECFYRYLDIVQNLQYILDTKGIDLSSHSNEILKIDDINNSYKTIFYKDNILKDLNTHKNKLYDMCSDILGGIINE